MIAKRLDIAPGVRQDAITFAQIIAALNERLVRELRDIPERDANGRLCFAHQHWMLRQFIDREN